MRSNLRTQKRPSWKTIRSRANQPKRQLSASLKKLRKNPHSLNINTTRITRSSQPDRARGYGTGLFRFSVSVTPFRRDRRWFVAPAFAFVRMALQRQGSKASLARPLRCLL